MLRTAHQGPIHMARSVEFILVTYIAFESIGITFSQTSGFENALKFAKKAAPVLKLHPEERFMPYNPLEFLRYVRLWKGGEVYPDTELPQGEDSADFFLVTKADKEELLADTSSFLYGVDPSRQDVPVFASIAPCSPDYARFSVTYWLFFPFNRGKNMCAVRFPKMDAALPVFKLFGRWCLGFGSQYHGDHIGDWERVTVEFKDWVLSRISLSVHSVRVEYEFNSSTNTFDLVESTTKGLTKAQDSPKTLHLNSDGRPIVYCSLGSHGLFAGPGRFMYTRLRLDQLSDETAEGGPIWDTSLDLRPFSVLEAPGWFTYAGHWGAPPSDCTGVLTYIGGGTVCWYGEGPRGLAVRKPDFPCA